jgi:hypothetical protein
MSKCTSKVDRLECGQALGHDGPHVASREGASDVKWANAKDVRAFFAQAGARGKTLSEAFEKSQEPK